MVCILILGTALITWMAKSHHSQKTLSKITCFGLCIVCIVMLIYSTSNVQVYTRLLAYNYFSYQLKNLIIGLSTIFAVFFCTNSIYRTVSDITYTVWLGVIFSLMLITSANSLITLYISFELYTITVCFLISCFTPVIKASLKFIILSAIMSCIFLYGASLYYTNTGSVSFYSINELKLDISGAIGILFVLSYFLFKINAAPFHMWSIVVYESAPMPIVLFLESVIKFIFVSVLCLFCGLIFLNGILFFQKFLLIIEIISMVIGGIAPFSQNNIKKFIAYSSVGQIGFALIILSIFDNISVLKYILTYLFSYMLGSACVFSGLICLNKYINVNLFSDLKGIIKIYPIYAYSIICGLFSIAGLPPFIGFIAKLNIFNTVIKHNDIYMCIIMFIYTILTVSYTVKALKYMFMKGNIEEKRITDIISESFNIMLIILLIVPNIYFKHIDKQFTQIIESLYYDNTYIKYTGNKQNTNTPSSGNELTQLYERLKSQDNKKISIVEKTLDKLLSD